MTLALFHSPRRPACPPRWPRKLFHVDRVTAKDQTLRSATSRSRSTQRRLPTPREQRRQGSWVLPGLGYITQHAEQPPQQHHQQTPPPLSRDCSRRTPCSLRWRSLVTNRERAVQQEQSTSRAETRSHTRTPAVVWPSFTMHDTRVRGWQLDLAWVGRRRRRTPSEVL